MTRFAGIVSLLNARAAAFPRALRAFAVRYLPNESQHLFALTLAVGATCGLLAVLFHLAIRFAEGLFIERALHATGNSWVVWTIVVPTIGGVLAGAILTFVVPGARGSGIPQVKQAFATESGRVPARDAIGKFLVSAFQIGSGASLGREGPTVHICSGAASLLARLTALPPRNMRRLTPVGVAAGIAAAFNAPIAAVTFTIEEIVGTLDQAVLSGVVVAAAVAAVIERWILGGHPVIEVRQAYGLEHASSLLHYALLGLFAAVVSVLFTDGLLRTRLWFKKLTLLPRWAHPGVGGLITGGLAVAALWFLKTTGVTGSGYETLGLALGGSLSLKVLALLCAAKVIATVFSYSSGGAGGIFAPTLFIGAMLGGAVGHLDVMTFGHEHAELGAFALVGMGAVFAGVIRAPITSVLIIFEMTGGYGLVLPLMLANMTSYVIARRLRPVPIYEALLEQDGIQLPTNTRSDSLALEGLQVKDAMTWDVATFESRASADETKAELEARGLAVGVVVSEDSVGGIVLLEDLRNATPETLLSALVRPAQSVHPDEPLVRAIVRMNDSGVRHLVVASTETHVVGMLAMSDVVQRGTRGIPFRSPSRVPAPPAPALTTSALTATALMIPARIVHRSTKVPELVKCFEDGEASAFVISEAPDALSVILPAYLEEFSRDEGLERMLIAEDVARPASAVPENALLPELAELLGAQREEVAVVVEEHGVPVGVMTRSALAEALLDRFVETEMPRVSP